MQEYFDNMFDIFDQNTKKVLLNSQKIARNLKIPTGTDHLLLSLLITPNTISQKILKKHFSSKNNTKLILNTEEFKEKSNGKNITSEFQNILKVATDLSTRKNKSKIDPQDLLMAIVNYKNCSAYKILKKLSINTQKIKDDLKHNNISNNNIENFYFPPNNQIDPNIPDQTFFIENPNLSDFNNPSKTKHSYLEQFGTNLTNLAKKNKLDKVIGRNPETERLIQILCRRTKNNPVLVGDPGVGKTAIIEGLAQKIIKSQVPLKLSDKKIIMLDLTSTVAGTMYRGQFETRMKNIIKEAKKDKNVILFIDEIHTVIGTGSAEGSLDTANILKPSLAKGDIRLIGATTTEEYRKNIEKDHALERRLQKITVNEPDKDETIKILNSTAKILEKYHNVKIKKEAIDSAIKLSERYISDRHLPDKAIDILDEAAAATNLNEIGSGKQKINLLNKKLKNILTQKEIAIQKQDFAQAAYLRSKELKIKQDFTILKKKNNISSSNYCIDAFKIAQIVSRWTQIPINNLIIEDMGEIKNLERKLSKNIIGQTEAIDFISSAIKKTKTQLADPNRPLGNFIFLGPTGVGKTELAKVLAKIIFGSTDKLIKIDMSEFMERHNLSRLVGAPPGYVGYDDAGKLTESVRNNPYSVVLLDEIEKAHPEVFNILLQIMEDGYLTDAKGKKVNFKNTIIIMTSNIGIDELNKQAIVGFNKKSDSYNNLKQNLHKELKKRFKPEFLNRLDNIIIFKPLSIKSIQKITKLQISELIERLKKLKIKLDIDEKSINYLAKKSYLPEYGAREVRRTIDKLITKPISELIIKNKSDKIISIRIKKNKVIIN